MYMSNIVIYMTYCNIYDLCPLCKNAEETTQHLFISCEVSQKVWDNYDRWLKISFTRHNVIGLSKKVNIVWKGMWMTI